MKSNSYIRFTEEQLSKIGNTIVYLSGSVPQLSKTKVLKLLYILDELSIRKSGIPFLNLQYKVWKFGPVSEELFIDLSSETTLLKDFIERTQGEESFIVGKCEFDDSEFSDNDILLMNYAIEHFGQKTAKELVTFTHKVNSPWYNTAKENAVLELLESEQITNTEFVIDLSQLVEHDSRKKEIYDRYTASH